MGVDVFLELKGFGLCNELRTLMGHWYVAQQKHGHLYVYWRVNRMCPDHFENLFEPLKDTTFVRDLDDFKKRSRSTEKAIRFAGQTQIHSILSRHGIKTSDKLLGDIYQQLKPKADIQAAIDGFLSKHDGLKAYKGLHVRRSDHVAFIVRLKGTYTKDEHFETIIEKDKTQRFYLATDNKKTQEQFASKYPDQIVVYKDIADVKAIRKTPLSHAVIDLYLLGHCKKIHGSLGSSFSEGAQYLQLALRS